MQNDTTQKRDMSFGWLLIVIMFALPVWGRIIFQHGYKLLM